MDLYMAKRVSENTFEVSRRLYPEFFNMHMATANEAANTQNTQNTQSSAQWTLTRQMELYREKLPVGNDSADSFFVKCYIIIVVLRGGLLPLPDEMQQPAQEERQHVAECGDDSHGNGVEHNGVGVQKCAACEHHDCFADTDAARSTGGDEANDPRE